MKCYSTKPKFLFIVSDPKEAETDGAQIKEALKAYARVKANDLNKLPGSEPYSPLLTLSVTEIIFSLASSFSVMQFNGKIGELIESNIDLITLRNLSTISTKDFDAVLIPLSEWPKYAGYVEASINQQVESARESLSVYSSELTLVKEFTTLVHSVFKAAPLEIQKETNGTSLFES